MKFITSIGQTVDSIAFNYYGHTNGTVEKILSANHGLAEHGAVLPHGLVIELPEIPQKQKETEIQLWD